MIRSMAVLVAAIPTIAFSQPPGLGQGWSAELRHAGDQLAALAEAIPEEHFEWRPGPGVRSVREVLMHVALGNYGLLLQAGGRLPAGTPKLTADLETRVRAKADVLRWLKASVAALEQGYQAADRTRVVRFLGKDTASEAVFLRALVHNHEHMGQMIAYARVMGVVPPWSKPGPE